MSMTFSRSSIVCDSVSDGDQATLQVSTIYYLRKLLRQYRYHLKSIVVSGASIPADAVSDLGAVLRSLYFEPEDILKVIDQLEYLVSAHQVMISQAGQFQTELLQIEEKIFWLLGYKLSVTGRQGSILLIDADPSFTQTLSGALQEKGYDLTVSTTANRALQKIHLNVPDVVLIASVLPDRTGFELCRHLKTHPELNAVPIFILGDVAGIQETLQAFEAGAIDYLPKPINLEDLTLRIASRRQLQDLQAQLAEQNEALQVEIQDRRRIEARYRNMFEQAVVGMFQSTREGRYLRVNQALAKLYGYRTPQELIPSIQSIERQIYMNADRRNEFVAYMDRFQQVTEFESEVQRADGKRIWISESVRAVADEAGNFLFYEGTVQDITARKQMEQLLKTQAQLTEILTTVPTVMQASAKILPAVGELLGWHRGELWLMHHTQQVMYRVDRWLAPDHQNAISVTTPPPPLKLGQGFPGLVWSHGELLWVADLQQIPQLTQDEQMRYRNLKSAIGLPLISSNRTVGLLLFFTRLNEEPSEPVMRVLKILANQVGQFIDLRYSQSALRQLQKRQAEIQ